MLVLFVLLAAFAAVSGACIAVVRAARVAAFTAAAFGPPTVELPPLPNLTFKNVNNNFYN